MRASIIVSAHNEGPALERTIASCIETTLDLEYELIVADDASTDGSVDAVVHRFPIVRVARHPERRGASPTKALGAREARGAVLVFVDGHTKPAPGALTRLVQDVESLGGGAIVTPTVAALDVQKWTIDTTRVGHGYRCDLETFACSWIPLTEMRAVPHGRLTFYESPALIGCVLAVSRELYDRLWGFDSHMQSWGVEDLDFGLKGWLMGSRILHDPEVSVGHRFRTGFDNYSVPIAHVVVNQLRLARKNFTAAVWGQWLERSRQEHAGGLEGHEEGLWAHVWELFQADRASAEAERAYLHARRVRDELQYAERFALPWPRLAVAGALVAAPRALFAAFAASPAPSPSPPPKCKVTGITPASPTVVAGIPQQFTANGTNAAAAKWSAPGATPATGTGATFMTKWMTTGAKTVTASCDGSTATAHVNVILPCTFIILGPADVPGLSRYTYKLNLAAGQVPTSIVWTVDKATAKIVGATNATTATVEFTNTADVVTLKVNFVLAGIPQCATIAVAIVKVDVNAPTFTGPGRSASAAHTHSCIIDPAPPAPSPTFVTRFTPGSNCAAFTFTGTPEAVEPCTLAQSGSGGFAITVTTKVTLTAPAARPAALQKIEVGLTQHCAESGSGLYATASPAGRRRTATLPAAEGLDWLAKSCSKGAGDTWPWQDTSNFAAGTGTGTFTTPNLTISDSPSIDFANQFNPNKPADPDATKALTMGTYRLAFTVRLAARTTDNAQGADTHFFEFRKLGWQANYVFPVIPGVPLATHDAGWTNTATPTEIDVNIVPSVTLGTVFNQWIPA